MRMYTRSFYELKTSETSTAEPLGLSRLDFKEKFSHTSQQRMIKTSMGIFFNASVEFFLEKEHSKCVYIEISVQALSSRVYVAVS